MNLNSTLAFVAAGFAGVLALGALVRKRRSLAGWSFAAGMAILALEALFDGLSFREGSPEGVASFQGAVFVTKAFAPAVWLFFSLTYSRGNYREFLVRWRVILVAALVLPVFLAVVFHTELLQVFSSPESGHGFWFRLAGRPSKALNGLFLVATVLILTNFERTFASAVGTARWRIKFFVLGVGVIFGARFYTGTEMLIFSGYSLSLKTIETAALLLGCVLIAAAYFRSGFSEIDVYPSRTVLQTSVTVLLAGAYLFVVGVLAQIAARFGGAGSFPIEAFLVLLGLVVLAVLLLSNRVRQFLQLFLSRHFKRPQHDFRQIWNRFSGNISTVLEEDDLCGAAGKLISETFNALSVSIWLFDGQDGRLFRASSTLHLEREQPDDDSPRGVAVTEWASLSLNQLSRPFELEKAKEKWTEKLKQINTGRFRTGGNRVCVPLVAGEHRLGIIILADRVGGLPYTAEEMDLLKCIGDQVAGSLLNIRLNSEVTLGKEMDALRNMSAFFIHDLKNTASTLNLMLQNLPVHFDDPSFREDALRGIGGAVERINHLIGSLSALRRELLLNPTEVDLNLLVTETLRQLDCTGEAKLITKLDPVPKIGADREQLQSVVTNLLLNAREAIVGDGQITVETRQRNGWVTLSVADNGCGMSATFVKNSLFRPFATTKKKGLGIGMFHAKVIVEAHRGNIQVKSKPGSGTTFEITLPLRFRGE
jgi:putative PEP-CTERM system histidine kinase